MDRPRTIVPGAAPLGVAAVLVVGLAAASALLAAPAPSYDPWAWLLWGREIAGGGLSTTEGPAFKPLAVAITTLLAPLGAAAPWLWVLLARAGAIAALLLSFRLARRLTGGSLAAGALAAAAVLTTGAFAGYAASGLSEGLFLALALAAAELWRSGRCRLALGAGVAAALLRVEAAPFLAAAGLLAWRRRPQDRPLWAAAALLLPAAWLLPELAGSGDPLRAGARARIPNPGQPALADVPAGASLREALALPPWPVWLGLAAAAALRLPRLLAPAAAGGAWILLVAAMAQGGFSGEARYALPGAALLSISGAAGLAAAARWAAESAARAGKSVLRTDCTAHGWRAGIALMALVAIVLPRAGDIADVRGAQAYQWRLQRDLADAIDAAGGRAAVLACGRPYVGPLRGPLMAYRLDVEKRLVEPDDLPRAPGSVFRSRLTRAHPAEPAAPPGFALRASTGAWEVLSRCRVRAP